VQVIELGENILLIYRRFCNHYKCSVV